MARKLITKKEHLRRILSEGEPNWISRQLICFEYLEARKNWPRCGYRLNQQKMAAGTSQIPDFLLTCHGEEEWAIEIGITGSARVETLEDAGYTVVKIGRGQGIDFDKKFTCDSCPYRE